MYVGPNDVNCNCAATLSVCLFALYSVPVSRPYCNPTLQPVNSTVQLHFARFNHRCSLLATATRHLCHFSANFTHFQPSSVLTAPIATQLQHNCTPISPTAIRQLCHFFSRTLPVLNPRCALRPTATQPQPESRV